MNESIIEDIESAIDNHPSKLDYWGLLACEVHGDGGFYFEFFYAPLMTEDSIKSSVYMRVIGTDSPDKIADVVWDFFRAYEGQEQALLEGRVKWRPWFSYSNWDWYIACVLAESEGLRDSEEFHEYAWRVATRLTDEMVAAYNDLITEHMLHGNTLAASAKLYDLMSEAMYEAVTHADVIHQAKAIKTTSPIIDLTNV